MKSNQPFETSKPIVRALLYALIPIAMAVVAGAVITMRQMAGNRVPFVQGLFFALAFAVALVIAKKQGGPLKNVGFRRPEGTTPLTWLAVLLMLVMSLLNLIHGLSRDLTAKYVLVHLGFAAIVGLTEETVFRGLVYRTLRYRGLRFSVLVSALLFGLGHVFQLLGGADTLLTLLQVLFAFLFGLVCVLLVVKTRSLLLPILLHMTHNFTDYLRVALPAQTEFLVGGVQCVLLVLVACVLMRSLSAKDKEAVQVEDMD